MTILDDSHRTDPGLVADVHMGRREAFAELYRRYYSAALRYALGMTRGDEARAQDVVSEAFTRVFGMVSRNGGVSAFWPYLLAAVRNAYRAELRSSGRVDLVERADDLDELAPDFPAWGDVEDPSVQAAFSRLPTRWQTVLWRSEIRGDTTAEIGQAMGISANAAAALACRAREGLRVEYLQDRLTRTRPSCRPYADQLAKFVRGMLSRRERRRVEAHVRGCDDCGRAVAELTALNGRMRSVLPLILGVWPLVSGRGFSSAQAGAVGSGLLGSAGMAASGAAGGAGLAGGATAGGAAGAASLAGLGGLGAVGVTHASAVAGLAVASVVAMLGLPVEVSSSEPAPYLPVVTTTVPTTAVPRTEPGDTQGEPLDEPASDEPATSDDPAGDPSSGLVAESTPESVLGGSLGENTTSDPTLAEADGTVGEAPLEAAGTTSGDGKSRHGAAPAGSGDSGTGPESFEVGARPATAGQSAGSRPADDGPSSKPGQGRDESWSEPGASGSSTETPSSGDAGSGYSGKHVKPAHAAAPTTPAKPDRAGETGSRPAHAAPGKSGK